MGGEYVQEHILTGGIVAPIEGGLADSFMTAYGQFARRCRVIPNTSAACVSARWRLHQIVADSAMPSAAVTAYENIECARDEMIVDDDAAIGRDAGVSGNFGVPPRPAASVKCRSRALRPPAPTKATRDYGRAAALHRSSQINTVSRLPRLLTATPAFNWRDNAASQTMFLNILLVHHTSAAAAEPGSDFRSPRERSRIFR